MKTLNMKTLISTLALALIVVFSSCSSVRNVNEPEFRDISNIRLINVGVLQTTAGADLVFYNPNDFGITLANARGDVYLDNAFFGRFDLAERVSVRRHSEFIIPVTFRIDNIGAIKNQRDIYKKKEALLRVAGYALVKKSGFSKEIPIRYEHMENINRLRSIVSR